MNNTPTRTAIRLGALLAASALVLAGCASPTAEPAADTETATQAEAFSISDAWVKAAESGMSAAFGELENASGEDVVVVAVSTDASPMIELHETVADEAGEMVMQEIDGGFVVPADGAYTLEPGGSHIMLMGLEEPLVAGDEVSFTLTFADDSTAEFTAPVKDYSGANENYVGDDSEMDMDESDDHSDHDH
ncbi:copper chaperone PCu(A)C [Microbacterium sp. SSW1-59]|uniref:copper chaperone PCu(A)C n=1 Tax=Microbacterium xanthum TaxID=3079794 RepID=UPI002AD55D25|nr:copper chaperone PCu(A)C [Microbacterium sp. SSW1-59]MDZ8200791.1 copper chaperone PCu(A)C [Microbacterium sp. SSW1-59]